MTDVSFRKDYTFFLLGYYWYRSDEINEKSLFFGLWKSTYFPAIDESRLQLFWFWEHRSSKERSKSYLQPLFYYYNSQSKFEVSVLMGLFKTSSFDVGKKEKVDDELRSYSSWKLAWGLVYRSHTYDWVANDFVRYQPLEVRESILSIFPLYYQNASRGLKKNYTVAKHLSWLFYKKYEELESDGKTRYDSTFAWFLPFVFRHATEESVHWNILGLIDWKRSHGIRTGPYSCRYSIRPMKGTGAIPIFSFS